MEGKHFPFEWLPAELRETIYEYLLISGKIHIRLVLTKGMDDYHSNKVIITGRDTPNERNRVTPGILRTSRQLYNEALPVLYSKNTFSFTSITSLRQFARDAKPGLEFLRHVEIATTGRFAFWEPMNQLLRAENLRSLTISLGPDDIKDKGWSELVMEVADFVVRKAPKEKRREELGRIGFVVQGSWEGSGREDFRSCGSDAAVEQVRGRIEKRLLLTGSLPG